MHTTYYVNSPFYHYYSNTNSPVINIIVLIFIIVIFTAFWKIFTKAGKPGWYSLIPFFNIYILLKISGKPGWWLILYFIPFVNLIISLLVSISLAKSFGRSDAFGVLGLWLFSIVGYPVLAFGSSKYIEPGGATSATPTTQVTPPAQPVTQQ